MPDCLNRDLTPWKTVHVHFKSRRSLAEFADRLGQRLTVKDRYCWFPKAAIMASRHKWISVPKVQPMFPIYIVSKGRWQSRLTAKALDRMGLDYSIVVEPQEADLYRSVIPPERVLVLPFSNLGQGSIPARNWIWEHAAAAGCKWHWVLDDNIKSFHRYHGNLKSRAETGAVFRSVEDFAVRYGNLGQAGLNYYMFVRKKYPIAPVYFNTRVYSCILLRTDLDLRWRGRYNEDTDLSLRILKEGLCTALFNSFLAWKMPTMQMRGGNTDELYKGDGRKLMAESLREQHPDCVSVTWKWGRWQHSVDYRPFKANKLELLPGVKLSRRQNNYGMRQVSL